MARVVTKGRVLQLTISSTLTAIPQLTAINHTGVSAQLTATPALDSGTGIPYTANGFTEGGSIEIEGYRDPAEANHQFITDMLSNPVGADVPNACKIIHADAATTEETGSIAGVADYSEGEDGGIATFSASLKLDGIMTYAT